MFLFSLDSKNLSGIHSIQREEINISHFFRGFETNETDAMFLNLAWIRLGSIINLFEFFLKPFNRRDFAGSMRREIS